MLVVSMDDRRLLRFADGVLTEVADLSAVAPWHCNDMVVDAVGRAYVGNFGFDLDSGADPVTTNLVRVDPDASMHVVAEDLRFPNGTVITPDGGTLVIGESWAGCLTAFDHRRRRRPVRPARVGEALGRGPRRHLSRRRGRHLVGVPADRAGAARAGGW